MEEAKHDDGQWEWITKKVRMALQQGWRTEKLPTVIQVGGNADQ